MNVRLEDRFELLGRLGGGSGGEVYRVRELATGAIKALKVMDARNTAIPGAEVRFRNECTGLEHEFLVRVDEVLRLSGNLCLVMELIEGDSLEKIINDHWNLPVEEKIRLMACVCRGLEFAHQSGRVHRDIKPSNILRQRHNGAPKIIDFGVAKKMGEHGPTVQGTVVGTFAYMSPEQVQGLAVDARSDIFSAAVVLYELLSGICPFDSAGEYQTKEKIVRGASPRLPVDLAGIPQPLHGLLERALAKDPAQRFATAGQMAEALEACLPTEQLPESRKEMGPQAPAALELAPAVVPTAAVASGQRWRRQLGAVALLLLAAMAVGGMWWAVAALHNQPRTAAELYADGVEKQRSGDQAGALELWSRACANQQGAACTGAGLIKANGLAGTTDNAWAVRFFQRGCELNHAWGCTHLGYHYQRGLGVDANRSKAASYYLKGCKSGDPLGCTLLTELGTSRLATKKPGKNKPGEPQEPGFTLPTIDWSQLPWNPQK